MDELYMGGELVDLGKDTKVGITLQVNDIAEMTYRQGNFSNTFKTPKTQINKAIYEHAEVVNSSTDKPYQKLSAKYIQDGIELVPNGYCKFVSAGNSYEQTIYSGILDFFSQIKGKKLSELDLSDYDHTWDLATVFASRVNTEGYIYPLIEFNDDGDTRVPPYMETSTRGVDVRTLFPAMFYHTLIQKIFDGTDYTLDVDVISMSKYLNRLFPFQLNKLEMNQDYVSSKNMKVKFNKYSDEVISGAIDYSGATPMIFTDETSPGYYDNPNAHDITTGLWAAPISGNYIFETNILVDIVTPHILSSSSIAIQIRKLPISPQVTYAQYANPSMTGTQNLDLTLTSGTVFIAEGTQVQIDLVIVSVSGSVITINKDCYFKAELQKQISFGGFIPMAALMPDMDQDELLKALAHQLAIIFVPDNTQKIIYFKQFGELYDNIPLAEDMSEKLDVKNEIKVSFRESGYAQKNWLRYKENTATTVSGIVPTDGLGDGFFTIDDENLELEKDLIVLPFSASDSVTRLNGLNVCLIPKLHAGAMVNNTGLRVVMLSTETITGGDIIYRDATPAGATLQSSTSIPLTYFIDDAKLDSLGFDRFLLSVEYNEYANRLMSNYKKVTANFRLSIKDVHNFDFFKPWYLKQYSNYFYVNKINNFIKGRLTSVELVKMG